MLKLVFPFLLKSNALYSTISNNRGDYMTNQNVTEKKGKSGCAVVLLCMAFLLIGAGAMYYLLQSKMQPVESLDSDKKLLTELNPDGVLVKDLISRLDYNTNCGVNEVLYKNSKTTIENLDDNYLKILIAKEANKNGLKNNISFTKEEFESSAKTLFGNNINLTLENITGICPSITYDEVNQKFNGNTEQCEVTSCSYVNERHIVKAEKDDDGVYIYVAVAAINQESRKISNLNDLNSVIDGIDPNTFDIKNDYSKVNNYKYTYTYDKDNNNYIFKSIELQK